MYLRKLEIKNIRVIDHFEMEFQEGEEAGWHVLIGDNGSGKSTIIRALATALIGPTEVLRLDPNWDSWLTKGNDQGSIRVTLVKDVEDKRSGRGASRGGVEHIHSIECDLKLERTDGTVTLIDKSVKGKTSPDKYVWGQGYGWFSAGFGPFRRFTGGNQSLERIYITSKRAGAHLTAFKEDAALTESIVWLKDVYLRSLEKAPDAIMTLEAIKKIVNLKEFLPNNLKLKSISSDGVFFEDSSGVELHLYELSDGIKSILSLIFELLRILIWHKSASDLFSNINNPDDFFIPIRGVVLIDEIDAHLHPTWQTKVGEWFMHFFPQIQFIITTHSPLICRAANRGSIWKLAAPGTDETSEKIEGVIRDRLIFGNILDAYGTQNFGVEITGSKEGKEMMRELADLNFKSMTGTISTNEKQRLIELRTIFPTE